MHTQGSPSQGQTTETELEHRRSSEEIVMHREDLAGCEPASGRKHGAKFHLCSGWDDSP